MPSAQTRSVDLLLSARWIIPVEPDGVVLDDHAIAVEGGRIVAILPRAEAEAAHAPRQRVHLAGHALIPGLVNAHTHAAMTLFRGLADDLPLMRWLGDHIWPAERRWVSDAFVREGTRLAVAEMLRGGTTCFNDMYFYPEEAARAASEAGIRATVGLIVLEVPTVWANDPDEYLAKGTEVHDALRGNPLVRTAFAPHAPYTVSDASLERIAVLAEELDIPVHMHVHETADEVAHAVEESGERPLARLARLGLLSPRLLAVHATQLEAAEIDLLAARGVHVVHCPESNLKLASGFCPAARLLEAGVNLAFGTDGAASNNDLDMLGEMRTATLLAKGVAGDASALPAGAALRAATLGGARALGLDDAVGSLEVGKAADIVAVDLDGPECQPVYHPISQVVYAGGPRRVSHVWVDGRPVLNDGALLTVDADDLVGVARAWHARVTGTPS